MIVESLFLLGLGYGAFRLARRASSIVVVNIAPKLNARYSLGTDVPSMLTGEWAQYNGARPELRGAPRNSILNVKGLADRSPEFRARLLDLAEETSIPVDSLAVVMSSESGFNPAAVYKKDGKPFAVGLFQLTKQANLTGFASYDDLPQVLQWTAEEQLDKIGRPYFARFKAQTPPTPGKMYMLNFMPEHAGKPDEHVMGVRGEKHPEGHPKAGQLTYKGLVYQMNPGFDSGGKTGFITVGAVRRAAATKARYAQGKRIAVDGQIIAPAQQPAGAAAPEAAAKPPQKRLTSYRADGVYLPSDTAGGLLLRAVQNGDFEQPEWRSVEVESGLVVEVMADALKASIKVQNAQTNAIDTLSIRLPVSYRDQVEIARKLGAISLTAEWWDRVWQSADLKIIPRTQQPDGTLAQSIAHSRSIDEQGARAGVLVRDVGKGWILHPRLSERGAVNYGWIDPASRMPLQSVGGRHDAGHYDYSQTAVLVKRSATQNGLAVDLLELLSTRGIDRRFLDAYR